VCRKEYDIKAAYGSDGYPMPDELPFDKWAAISFLPPRQEAKDQAGFYAVEGTPEGVLVCSQACAEKALDGIRERLRSAFEKTSGGSTTSN